MPLIVLIFESSKVQRFIGNFVILQTKSSGMKYTTTNLKKLEALFEELSYTVRYEKGNFQSGYCVVQDKKIAVVNKFYDTEGRMNCLLEILQSLEINVDQLSEKSAKIWKESIALNNSEIGDVKSES